jgi:SAM-dependent methyltransferase
MGTMKPRFWARIIYGYAWAYELGDALVHFPDVCFRRFQKIRVPADGARVLELGCGTGRSARMFDGRGVTAVHMDINRAFVAYGKRKGRLRTALVGSAYDLCFASAVFDCIIVPDAFHHIVRHERMFEECARTLKPGGRLIIFDIVLRKRGPNRIVNHVTDGPIWMLDVDGFREKMRSGSAAQHFELEAISAVQEKTIMGLLGGIDVQAILVKKPSRAQVAYHDAAGCPAAEP